MFCCCCCYYQWGHRFFFFVVLFLFCFCFVCFFLFCFFFLFSLVIVFVLFWFVCVLRSTEEAKSVFEEGVISTQITENDWFLPFFVLTGEVGEEPPTGNAQCPLSYRHCLLVFKSLNEKSKWLIQCSTPKASVDYRQIKRKWKEFCDPLLPWMTFYQNKYYTVLLQIYFWQPNTWKAGKLSSNPSVCFCS